MDIVSSSEVNIYKSGFFWSSEKDYVYPSYRGMKENSQFLKISESQGKI